MQTTPNKINISTVLSTRVSDDYILDDHLIRLFWKNNVIILVFLRAGFRTRYKLWATSYTTAHVRIYMCNLDRCLN